MTGLSEKRQAGAEIEITPAAIEAGASILANSGCLHWNLHQEVISELVEDLVSALNEALASSTEEYLNKSP